MAARLGRRRRTSDRLVFNLGWFFVPPDVWFEDPGLVPMPEVLLGWWTVAIGLALVMWAVARRTRR